MKYQKLKEKTLALFFTTGVSLQLWDEIGMIRREVAIYNELSNYFEHVYFFTYGSDDLKFSHSLPDNITVIPKRYIKNNLLYSFVLPLVHWRTLKKVDILKTNQMLGSWSAALAKLFCRKKFVVRIGYMWSIHLNKENVGSWQKTLSKKLEKLIYKIADSAITSSENNFDYVEHNYRPRDHVLIPNYVEIDIFKPLSIEKVKNSICFVGRLSKQKNLFALFDALIGLPYTIDIIGSGELKEELKEYATKQKVKANFLGNIPNHVLPKILNQHELFILPSLWEGMPKTLLEAMACGLPVIGTNVDGTREIIQHGENGILCDTDPKSIREAIMSVMEDEVLKEKLGENARKTIEQGFSLENLIKKELDLYARLLS